MSLDLAGEVHALRTEVSALTQGLLIQQDTLRIMDEKLTRLLQAATQEEDESGAALDELLANLVEGIRDLLEGQQAIRKLMGAHVH